jgi:[ribosomal protein S5]-alanine N-acetyltransferase
MLTLPVNSVHNSRHARAADETESKRWKAGMAGRRLQPSALDSNFSLRLHTVPVFMTLSVTGGRDYITALTGANLAPKRPTVVRNFANVDKNKEQVAEMLQTERLDLREFRATDFNAVHAYASDLQVTRFTSFGPNTPAETQDFLTRTIAAYQETPRRNFVFGIVDRASGQLFGSGGIEACDATGRHFAFGYCLHRDWWGRGFGSEAASALVEFGFEQMEAHRLWAHVFVGNIASARILEGLGFRREGVELQCLYVRNAWHDLITYARLSFE